MNHFWLLHDCKYQEIAESDIYYFLLNHPNEEVMIEERVFDSTVHAWLVSKECDYRIPDFFLPPQEKKSFQYVMDSIDLDEWSEW
jgi:hypothetical protein